MFYVVHMDVIGTERAVYDPQPSRCSRAGVTLHYWGRLALEEVH